MCPPVSELVTQQPQLLLLMCDRFRFNDPALNEHLVRMLDGEDDQMKVNALLKCLKMQVNDSVDFTTLVSGLGVTDSKLAGYTFVLEGNSDLESPSGLGDLMVSLEGGHHALRNLVESALVSPEKRSRKLGVCFLRAALCGPFLLESFEEDILGRVFSSRNVHHQVKQALVAVLSDSAALRCHDGYQPFYDILVSFAGSSDSPFRTAAVIGLCALIFDSPQWVVEEQEVHITFLVDIAINCSNDPSLAVVILKFFRNSCPRVKIANCFLNVFLDPECTKFNDHSRTLSIAEPSISKLRYMYQFISEGDMDRVCHAVVSKGGRDLIHIPRGVNEANLLSALKSIF